MHRKNIVTICVLTLFFFLQAGCKRDEFTWGTKIGDITYSGNAVLLGDEELSLIKEVTDNEIIFTEKKGALKNITSKSILVMGVSEKTPYGLLRRVNSLETNGTELVISTTPAQLDEAIKEGIIKFKKKLLEKDFKIKSKIEGVLVKGPNKSFDGLALTMENLEVYDDGTKTAGLSGAIGISPEIDLTIEIQFNEIKKINIVTTLNKIDEVALSSNGPFSGQKEIVAAEFIHSPVIIDSLVFVPEIKIFCGFDGTVSSDVSSGVRQDRTITSVIDYGASKWSEDPLTHSESFDFIKPVLTDNSQLKIYSGPEINIRLFGIPIQVIKVTGFYSLEAEKTASPSWRLFIGTDGQNTIKGEILGLREDYTQNLSIEALEIANANDN
jgi:hypothetical protein